MISFLWLSLAVPIVIHLVHRRKAKRVLFSTLRFLRMVDRRVARRQRLKELLLLAVRLLLLAALIGALYRPMVRSSTFKGSGVPTAVAIVLDNTYSMRTVAGGVERFDRARRAASTVLDGLKTGDAAVIVPFDARAEAAPEPSTGLGALRDQVRGMVCGYGTAAVAPAVQRALAALARSNSPRKEVYVITDFQRLSWTPAVRDLRGDLPADLPVFLVDVGGQVSENLALTGAEFGLNVQVAGTPSELYCSLRNAGLKSAERQLVLLLDGESAADARLSLASGAETTAVFRHTFGHTGEFSGEVRLAPDELGVDNSRYFTIDVHDRLPVLLVNGDPSQVPYLNETFYLDLALRAPAGPGEQDVTLSPIQTHVVAAGEFLQQRPEDYGCIILANVPRLPGLWGERLLRYVQGGGGLIIFLGDRADPASYNAALSPTGGEALLPAELAEAKDAPQGGSPVRLVSRGHPVFRNLAGHLDTDAARVSRYFSITNLNQGASVLAELDGGPLLIEKRTGPGIVILSTTSADMDWTNLPARSLFLPLLQQMVYYAGRSAGRVNSVAVGMPYAIDMPATPEAVKVSVRGPASGEKEGEPLAVLDVPAGGGRAVFEDTYRPGIYRASWSAGGSEQTQTFAVNVDPAESAPERMDPEEARKMLGAAVLRVVTDTDELGSIVLREREGLPLWNYLFAAAIVFAVIESYVGNALLRH
jgi:hypothetical protein